MTAVNIAQLRGHLSTYLKRVRRGEEILIRDRDTPVAKLVPLREGQIHSKRMLRLAARGLVRLPKKPMDWDAFFALPAPDVPLEKLLAALDAERGED